MMNQSSSLSPELPGAGGSERIRLARAARAAALAVPGVVRTDAGAAGLLVTVGDGERIEGVRAVAAQGGGYELSLELVCQMVPLLDLARQVKSAVARAAVTAGISIDDVNVTFCDIATPEPRA